MKFMQRSQGKRTRVKYGTPHRDGNEHDGKPLYFSRRGTLAATQEPVSQMTLNLKGEGMPAYAPTLEGEEMVVSSVATLETTLDHSGSYISGGPELDW